jgi:iron complex outermembrane receptor protein
MKAKLLLALLPAACLCWPTTPAYAQNGQGTGTSAQSSSALSHPEPDGAHPTGRIVGVLKDPSGAVIAGASIELKNPVARVHRVVATDGEGRFAFEDIPAGNYQVTVTAKGFDIAILHNLAVTAGSETAANVALKIAPAKTSVEVNEAPGVTPSTDQVKVDAGDQAGSRNAAELVGDAPGVSLRDNGQLASVPLLHGLGDERAKLVVNGMTVSSACANHMNPPLSYVAPSQASEMTVMAGITPVSMGGDSIGGTIAVESRRPVFATGGESLREEDLFTGFYRSNGRNYGGSLTGWISGRNLAMGYAGAWTTNDDYTDGSGHKVTSTYAQSTDLAVTLAAEESRNLFTIEAGLHHTPYQGFPNAQMDMVRNYAESVNLHYHRSFEGGGLDAHVFWQGTWHSMNIGRDKSTFPMPMWMPMNTHGRDMGYAIKFEAQLADRHTLRVGNELHRFVLDDRWPAVAGTAPYMGPNTFVSMNDGRRMRLGTFAEVASKWNAQWTTLFGLRNDTVWSNAGPVQGYSDMYGADADAFNALNHAKTDADFDLSGIVRYDPNSSGTYELGYARKTRSPTLYERYAWSTNMMASGMIGWFGDGNYYVGNVGLKPETANTVSGTASWHGGTGTPWAIKLTPYMTYVQDYVDVDTMMTTMYGMSTFAQLQFANHDARIYGTDLSGSAVAWSSLNFGQGKIGAVAGWLHGERTDTSTGLYQMMPLNLRIALDEELKGLTAGLTIQAVDRKSSVDPHRFEQKTPGYTLFKVHAGYRRGHFLANAAADNLLNKWYELPLGGVNFDDFMESMWMGQIKPLTGRGRSVSFSLTAQF